MSDDYIDLLLTPEIFQGMGWLVKFHMFCVCETAQPTRGINLAGLQILYRILSSIASLQVYNSGWVSNVSILHVPNVILYNSLYCNLIIGIHFSSKEKVNIKSSINDISAIETETQDMICLYI